MPLERPGAKNVELNDISPLETSIDSSKDELKASGCDKGREDHKARMKQNVKE